MLQVVTLEEYQEVVDKLNETKKRLDEVTISERKELKELRKFKNSILTLVKNYKMFEDEDEASLLSGDLDWCAGMDGYQETFLTGKTVADLDDLNEPDLDELLVKLNTEIERLCKDWAEYLPKTIVNASKIMQLADLLYKEDYEASSKILELIDTEGTEYARHLLRAIIEYKS